MFINMVNELCFHDNKKAKRLNDILIMVFYKNKFNQEDYIQLLCLGIPYTKNLRNKIDCDFMTLLLEFREIYNQIKRKDENYLYLTIKKIINNIFN